MHYEQQVEFELGFRRLVKAVRECARERISCEDCPSFVPCLAWWDENVCSKYVTSERLDFLLNSLAKLRRSKGREVRQ